MKISEPCPVLEICRWFECDYRVYVEVRDLYRKLIRRKGCTPHGIYHFPNGSIAWDVIVPEDQIDSVRKLLKAEAGRRNGASQSLTPKVPTNPRLNNNRLRKSKAALGARNST